MSEFTVDQAVKMIGESGTKKVKDLTFTTVVDRTLYGKLMESMGVDEDTQKKVHDAESSVDRAAFLHTQSSLGDHIKQVRKDGGDIKKVVEKTNVVCPDGITTVCMHGYKAGTMMTRDDEGKNVATPWVSYGSTAVTKDVSRHVSKDMYDTAKENVKALYDDLLKDE